MVDKVGNHVNTWEEYFSCYTYASTYEGKESGDEVTEENRSVTFSVRYCRETAAVTSNGYRVNFHGDLYNILHRPDELPEERDPFYLQEGGAAMSRNCSIDELADVINEGLKEYAELSASQVKSAVRKTARTVRGEIESGAPVRTGQYAKSWKVKTTEENSQKLVQTVYSPTRYMLAHLLEKGHAKRGGGRVAGKPHIAPAEAAGVKQLESLIEKALKG